MSTKEKESYKPGDLAWVQCWGTDYKKHNYLALVLDTREEQSVAHHGLCCLIKVYVFQLTDKRPFWVYEKRLSKKKKALINE